MRMWQPVAAWAVLAAAAASSPPEPDGTALGGPLPGLSRLASSTDPVQAVALAFRGPGREDGATVLDVLVRYLDARWEAQRGARSNRAGG